MELGISLSSRTPQPGRAAGRHLIECARVAHAAGLATLSLGDRHAIGPASGYFQNTPSLARLLADWTGRPAGCLFLLPKWPPVLVAEHIGTLANLHDAPFFVQTGLGHSPHEFAALGASTEHRVTVFEEAMHVVQALLAGETVSSQRFGFDDVSIGLVPERPVEWWMGTSNPAGLRRAARFGAAWYPMPAPVDEHRTRDEIYRTACDESGTTARVHLRSDGVVLRDGARARRLADDALTRGYRGMSRDAVLAGNPAEVAEQLAPWAERGVDQIIARTMGLGDAIDLETIECLGEVRSLLAGT